MKNNKLMWSVLVHLGNNMWNEEGNTRGREKNLEAVASPILRFNRPLWDEYMVYLREKGADTLIIDIGEAMVYEKHPELAVEGSWTKEQMAKEIESLQKMGFEVVPKLNFSAAHDIWMKEYSYMLSTDRYREVVADLIGEVCEVFKPKYFHLGMDEETWPLQKDYYYAVIRQDCMWWRDFYHMVDCVEKANARPWIWSDRMWEHSDDMLKNMPKSVIQSNWYYSNKFGADADEKQQNRLKAFELLDKHGFDQVPTGSNWSYPENMEMLTKYCIDNISSEHLLGFMQTPWLPFMKHCRNVLFEAADKLADAKAIAEG